MCCSTDQVKGVLTLQGDALSQAVSPWPLSPFHVAGEAGGKEHGGLLLISVLPQAGYVTLGRVLDHSGLSFLVCKMTTPNLLMTLACGFSDKY